MAEFNKTNFKKLVKDKYDTYEKFRDHLQNAYDLNKKLNTVQKWGQVLHPSVPQSRDMPSIAAALGVEVIDLYTDAEKARNKITNQELLSNQSKYSQSISKAALSTFSPEMKMFINNFMLLSEEEKQHYYEEIADIAARKLIL
ncbi:hypothetical protein [Sulfuricurvum sp.]|uniref:hypothetical protein n=1 Tax=Sulfuricurvum sp. TaxID=2025608 RepID=UPI002E30D901|nr:hypothetical protein [Sulfuricurvum sp.]HEX5330811.1 hypothetical protein [Sulfuricurvum sp.]